MRRISMVYLKFINAKILTEAGFFNGGLTVDVARNKPIGGKK